MPDQDIQFMKDALLSISNRLDEIAMINGVDVNNLDEVRAGFHNELREVVSQLKNLTSTIGKLKTDTVKVSNLKDAPVQKEVSISNLKDLRLPETVSVSNLGDLKASIEALANEIKSIQFNPIVKVQRAAQKITVQPTPVTINERSLDLEPVVRAIDLNLNKLRTNDVHRPLAVRLTDGQNWVKQIAEGIKQGTSQVFTSFPGLMGIRGKTGAPIDPATSDDVSGGKLVPQNFDEIGMDVPSKPTIITYKLKGATIATLTLSYSGNDISGVVRS
jgi:hypothetical protein